MSGHVEINLDVELLQETGLLWKINHDLLHPMGLALGVRRPVAGEGREPYVYLSVLVARDGAWQFDAGIDEEFGQMFNDWYRTRVVPEFESTETMGGHNNG